MFDTDTFLAQCIDAVGETQPRLAIKELLEDAVADPASVARSLPPERAGIARAGDTLAPSGGKDLRSGDVVLLGDDVVHAVTNPTAQFTGAIHIYGGDFFSTPRSEWRGEPPTEQPYDVEYVLDYFEQANRQHQA
jgi:hypothetical protein